MSVICQYLIMTPGWREDEESMRAVNLALHIADTQRRQTFNKIDMDKAGGNKYFTKDVWAASFNYLDPGTIDDAIVSAHWNRPHETFVYCDPGDYMTWDGWTEGYVDACMKSVTQMRAGNDE